jgi:hypothetical protein
MPGATPVSVPVHRTREWRKSGAKGNRRRAYDVTGVPHAAATGGNKA